MRGSADNVDMRVDTPDGRGTFHGTAVSAYLRLLPDALSNTNDELFSEMLDTADPIDLVHDIPSTILDLQPYPIYAGSQRPHASPHYENYKQGKHQTNVTNAQQQDLLWLILIHRDINAQGLCVIQIS